MLIWILQTGEPLNCDNQELRGMRAINLADALISSGHKVEIVSTKFFHQKKFFRNLPKKNFQKNNLVETLISSTGYEKNISLKRFLDHHVLFFTLLYYLAKSKDKPDLMFIGCPPLEWALAATIYSYIKNIPTVVDIKDLWPDIFWDKPKISNLKKLLLQIIFTPYIFYASIIATFATYITGPTIELADFFTSKYKIKFISAIFNKKHPKTFASPIVPPTETSKININLDKKINPEKCLKIFFIGSLMSVYDFKTVSESLKLLESKNVCYKLNIAGEGGNAEEIKNILKDLRNVEFLGWITREKAIKIANNSHLGIAPYKNMLNYELNLVNKYIDYMSLGLPVLSPLKGHIYSLIKKNKIGFNYESQNFVNLAEVLIKASKSHEKMSSMSKNAYKLFLNEYNYQKVYGNLVKKLENL